MSANNHQPAPMRDGSRDRAKESGDIMTTLPQAGNGNHDGQANTTGLLDTRISSQDAEVKSAGPADHNDSKTPVRRNRHRRFMVLWAALIVLCIGAGVYYVLEMMPFETTDDASIEGHVI